MLKTSALETPYGGQITLLPQLITKFSCNAPTAKKNSEPFINLKK